MDVEELLRATEDELLLDLSVGSHMSKVAPSYIDSDLSRRFQVLKRPSTGSASSSSIKPISTSKPPPQKPPSEKSIDDIGDLLARLAALKGTLHSSAIAIGESEELGQRNQLGDSNEEDEVEKIIQWAKDAARLDPSPPTDSDDSDNFQPSDVGDDDDDDSEDEEEEERKRRPKKKHNAKKKGVR